MHTYVYVYIYIHVYVYVYKALDFQFLYPHIGQMMMTEHRNLLPRWLTSYFMKNKIVLTGNVLFNSKDNHACECQK